MPDRARTLEAKLAGVGARRPDLSRPLLFGSRARGDAWGQSEPDLGAPTSAADALRRLAGAGIIGSLPAPPR